jgi:hypothetical protein
MTDLILIIVKCHNENTPTYTKEYQDYLITSQLKKRTVWDFLFTEVSKKFSWRHISTSHFNKTVELFSRTSCGVGGDNKIFD